MITDTTEEPKRKRKYRAAVIDDHPQFRDHVVSVLKLDSNFSTISQFKSSEEFINSPPEYFPDLIFLDIHLPHMSGSELLKRIKATHPDAKIIMITNMDSEEHVFNCLKFGALGFVYKMDLKNLQEIYKTVLDGGAVFSPTIALRIATNFQKKEKNTLEDNLSDREKQILELIIACKRDQEISDILQITHSTVRFHIGNICKKLHAKNKMELTRIAREFGWI
jgi:DNA-binding NarL/FixJ family response regulator